MLIFPENEVKSSPGAGPVVCMLACFGYVFNESLMLLWVSLYKKKLYSLMYALLVFNHIDTVCNKRPQYPLAMTGTVTNALLTDHSGITEQG